MPRELVRSTRISSPRSSRKAYRTNSVVTFLRQLNATIKHLDYSNAVDKVRKRDLVYLDPPYSGRFTGYHQSGFGMGEQEKLAELFKKLHLIGAYLMLSDGIDDQIVNLYRDFTAVRLHNRVALSGEAKGRKKVEELLVINYDRISGDLLNTI